MFLRLIDALKDEIFLVQDEMTRGQLTYTGHKAWLGVMWGILVEVFNWR